MTDARVARLYVVRRHAARLLRRRGPSSRRGPWAPETRVGRSARSPRSRRASSGSSSRACSCGSSRGAARARQQRRGGAGAGAADRDASAARDHEDVVIERTRFRAMGTDVELLVRPSNGAADARSPRSRAEFERLEPIMSRFRPDSELSELNRAGALDASAGPRSRSSSSRSRRASGRRSLRPDGPRRSRRSRLRPDVRGARPGRPGAPRVRRACGGGVTVADGEIELERGVRLDLGGIGKGYAAERVADLLAAAGPCLVDAGGDIAVRGGTLARRRRDGRRRPDARARARRRRDVRHRPAPLDARRRGAAPPDRSAHRPRARERSPARDRRSPTTPSRRRCSRSRSSSPGLRRPRDRRRARVLVADGRARRSSRERLA